MKYQNFERVLSNFFGKLIHASFGMLPNVGIVWFPYKWAMDSQKHYFSCCVCLRATKTSSMDGSISFLEMDMAKKYVNQNFNKKWVVHNLNN